MTFGPPPSVCSSFRLRPIATIAGVVVIIIGAVMKNAED
jgi:hypothetical protein